jgi:hypothetical protein
MHREDSGLTTPNGDPGNLGFARVENSMSDDHDLLITRYLEGTATAEEMQQVDRLVRTDAAFRESLLVAARQSGDLKRILPGLDLSAPAKPPRRVPIVPLIAAAAFLVILAVVLLGRHSPAPPPGPVGGPKPPDPPATQGFDKDLKGWQIRSGKWFVRDGVLTGEAPEGGIRVESEAEYKDFELTCSVRMEGVSTAEVQVRSYAWYVATNWMALKDWTEVKITARGQKLEAWVNGAAFTLTKGNDPDRPSGTVSFYAGGKTKKFEVRDLRIKVLDPK